MAKWSVGSWEEYEELDELPNGSSYGDIAINYRDGIIYGMRKRNVFLHLTLLPESLKTLAQMRNGCSWPTAATGIFMGTAGTGTREPVTGILFPLTGMAMPKRIGCLEQKSNLLTSPMAIAAFGTPATVPGASSGSPTWEPKELCAFGYERLLGRV
jgi:hypothetical protein